MPSEWQIRPCTTADLAAVRALLIETWHHTYDTWLGPARVREITEHWHSEPQLAAQIERAGSTFLVAADAEILVGTSFAHELDDGCVEIGRLYVRPGVQGLGIGSALLAGTIASFPATGAFVLDVEPRNTAAIGFYRRRGFALTGVGHDSGGSESGISHLRMAWQRPIGTGPSPVSNR